MHPFRNTAASHSVGSWWITKSKHIAEAAQVEEKGERQAVSESRGETETAEN